MNRQLLNFYNDNDPHCCAWINELIDAKNLSPGVVSLKSIHELNRDAVTGYNQVHLFAGIGGWSRALKLAGWPASAPVWTGSCPCQPLSCAGKRGGEKDERHLWPEFYRLISECLPPVVFGEQVASKDGLEWFDGISLDLEELGYAVGSSDYPAAGAGSPHIRQRLYWVAHYSSPGLEKRCQQLARKEFPPTERSCKTSRMAVSDGRDSRDSDLQCGRQHGQQQKNSESCGMGDAPIKRPFPSTFGNIYRSEESGRAWDGELKRPSFWSDYDLIPCRDGKTRRVESGTFPLAHGIPGRVGLLRGYGNAIVPQVAAEFIKTYLSVIL